MKPLVDSMLLNLYDQFNTLCAAMPGVDVVSEPDRFCIVSKHPDLLYNELDKARFSEGQAEECVRKVLTVYASRGHLPMLWVVTPISRPRNLPKILEAQGFKPHTTWRGMFLPVETFNRSIDTGNRLKVIQVTDPDQLSRWLIPYKESYHC
jgi:hypothetical protein